MKTVIHLFVAMVTLSLAACGQATVQTINTGTSANDGSGDTIRLAFGKANTNFAALSASISNATQALTTVKKLAYKAVTNANYTIATNDSAVVSFGLSATRVFTLPSAASVPKGWHITVSDGDGSTVSGGVILGILRSGSDTVNQSNISSSIGSPYQSKTLFSDGVSNWTVDESALTKGYNLSDLTAPSVALANLGGAPIISPNFTGTVTLPSGTTLAAPTISGGVTIAGVVNSTNLSATYAPISPYVVTSTGLTATVGGGVIIWADGTSSSVASQSIALIANSTNYLGIDLFDLSLHNYIRALDMGTKFVAAVVTGSSGVTSVQYLAPNANAPNHRFEAIKQKMLAGNQMVKVSIFGDSISLPYPTYTTNWWQALFTQPTWASSSYLTHTATWYATNYSVGTQSPIMAMAMIGSEVESPVAGGGATLGGNFGYADPYYSDNVSGGAALISPAIETQPDLVIAGFYNQVPNFMTWLERLVQRSRATGTAVILWGTSADFGTSNTDHINNGPTERLIADQHGAMYVDTWARNYEYHVLLGNSPTMNADTGLHPNDLGNQLYAKWFRSVLTARAQTPERIMASPIMVTLPNGTYSQFGWPWNMDLEFVLTGSGTSATSITYNNVNTANGANPAIIVGQRNTSTGAYSCPAGSSLNWSHPCAQSIAVIADGNTGTWTWTLSMGGTTVSTGTGGGQGPRAAINELASVDVLRAVGAGAYNHGPSDYFVNAGFKLTINTGTATIYGVAIGTPARRSVPIHQLEYVGGGWDITNTFGANWQNSGATGTFTLNTAIPARATDNVGDYVKFNFQGAGAQMLIESGIGGGRVQVYFDGKLVNTINTQTTSSYLETYLTASRFIPVNLFAPTSGDNNFFGSAQHSVKVVLISGTSSPYAGSPTVGYRRLKVVGFNIFGSHFFR